MSRISKQHLLRVPQIWGHSADGGTPRAPVESVGAGCRNGLSETSGRRSTAVVRFTSFGGSLAEASASSAACNRSNCTGLNSSASSTSVGVDGSICACGWSCSCVSRARAAS